MSKLNGVQVFDAVQIAARTITDEGYLIAKDSNLARTGIQEYYRYELGLTGDQMGVIRMYRPPEEVFDAESLKSFEHKPITDNHPKESVTAANWSKLSKGEVRDVKQSGDFMVGTLVVKAKDAIELIESGKVQLSNGYSCDFDMTPGTAPDGSVYDGIQRNIRGNHVALVTAARCGSACRVADSKPNEGVIMPKKVSIKGVPFEIADESAAAAIEQVLADNAALTAQVQTLTDAAANAVKFGNVEIKLSDVAGVQKVLSDAAATIADMEKNIITPDKRDALVADWSKFLDDAKRLMPTLDTKGKTCFDIRKEVISAVIAKDATAKAQTEAILQGVELNVADEATVKTVFSVLASAKVDDKNVVDNSQQVADALTGKTVDDGKEPQLVGRAAFLARQEQGYAE
jgi:hypothetical protein